MKDFLYPTTERIDHVVFSRKFNEEYNTPFLTIDGRYEEDYTIGATLKKHFQFLYDTILEEYLIIPNYETSKFDSVKWKPCYYFMAEIYDLDGKINTLDEHDYFIFQFKNRDNLFMEIKKDETFDALLRCCKTICSIMS